MLTRVKNQAKCVSDASPATMQELSEMLGISRVTVSKVLNSRPGVAPETRQRILEAVKATAFQPNELARGLRRQRTNRLGVIITGVNGWTFTNWYYGEYLRGILERAESLGYNIMLYTHRAAPELAKDLSRIARSRETDALLLVGSNATAEQVQSLLKHAIPFALLGALPEGIDTNGVYYDNAAGARLAVEHLVRQGHRRIGILGTPSPENVRFLNLRMQGAITAMRDAGLEPLGLDTYVVTVDALADLAKSGPCAAVSLIATEMHIQMLLGLGLRVPGDVEVVGFSSAASQYRLLFITTIEQPLVEIGKRAVDKVVWLINEGKAVMPSELLPMRLVSPGSYESRPTLG